MRLSSHRGTAWLALLVFLASVAVPLVTGGHALFEPASPCEPDAVVADSRGQSDPQIEATSLPRSRHCGVCHWLRALGSVVRTARNGSLPNLRFARAVR